MLLAPTFIRKKSVIDSEHFTIVRFFLTRGISMISSLLLLPSRASHWYVRCLMHTLHCTSLDAISRFTVSQCLTVSLSHITYVRDLVPNFTIDLVIDLPYDVFAGSGWDGLSPFWRLMLFAIVASRLKSSKFQGVGGPSSVSASRASALNVICSSAVQKAIFSSFTSYTLSFNSLQH